MTKKRKNKEEAKIREVAYKWEVKNNDDDDEEEER